MSDYLFTSESVTQGHPDKIADQISDAILDAFLSEDKHARVACETLVNTGLVVISGEISTTADFVDLQKIARKTICDIGYNNHETYFDGNACAVISAVDEQSPDINQGVDRAIDKDQGAGDQGLVFGFACDETKEKMPISIQTAHNLAKKLETVRKNKTVDFFLPDGKVQVTFAYQNDTPKYLDTVLISSQHKKNISQEKIRESLIEEVIKPVCQNFITEKTKILTNPTGKFEIGGPQGDCGLTGRKIIVDTYGGFARHGGGAFSGKDPSKTDRSGAYAARWVAKNIVAKQFAKKCEIQIAYAIGVSKPVSLHIETFGTETVSREKIIEFVRENFDLTPFGIISSLDLLRPIYSQTSCYGHFGKSELPWEQIL